TICLRRESWRFVASCRLSFRLATSHWPFPRRKVNSDGTAQRSHYTLLGHLRGRTGEWCYARLLLSLLSGVRAAIAGDRDIANGEWQSVGGARRGASASAVWHRWRSRPVGQRPVRYDAARRRTR